MNYILFNADGSIKKTNFTEVINQNSNLENQIFVSVDDLDIATHNLVGVFVLPNGEISTEAGVATSDVEYIEGVEADGYLLTLTQSETFISGLVFLTLQIKETSTNKVLYTYRVALTINKSAALASVTQITLAQYNALKDYIDSNFVSDVDLDNYATKSWVQSLGYATTSWVNTNYATKSETKLYRHTVRIEDGHNDYVVLIIISKNGNAIQYLNELGDSIQGFVNGIYEDEHALIYPLLECSVNLTAFGFAFIDENHEFFDATWSNATIEYDMVEEI